MKTNLLLGILSLSSLSAHGGQGSPLTLHCTLVASRTGDVTTEDDYFVPRGMGMLLYRSASDFQKQQNAIYGALLPDGRMEFDFSDNESQSTYRFTKLSDPDFRLVGGWKSWSSYKARDAGTALVNVGFCTPMN